MSVDTCACGRDKDIRAKQCGVCRRASDGTDVKESQILAMFDAGAKKTQMVNELGVNSYQVNSVLLKHKRIKAYQCKTAGCKAEVSAPGLLCLPCRKKAKNRNNREYKKRVAKLDALDVPVDTVRKVAPYTKEDYAAIDRQNMRQIVRWSTELAPVVPAGTDEYRRMTGRDAMAWLR